MSRILFELGNIYITKGANNAVGEIDAIRAIQRHRSGDWGDLCEEDKDMNNASIIHGDRLLSSYKTFNGVKFWIITEADRSSTTILLPEEY